MVIEKDGIDCELTICSAVPTSVEDYGSAIGKTTFAYNGYLVDYCVTNVWEDSQTVEFTIANTNEESILLWY